jgi:hypothetical protein
MRKRLVIVLAVCLTAIMAYGVIGSGATFTSSTASGQTITVGSMTLKLTSDNGTVNDDGTLTCPPVAVSTATGSGAVCDVTISVEGGIVPSLVTITPSQTGAKEPDKFAVLNKAGASFPISAGHFVYLPAAPGQSLPLAEKFHVEWTDLGNTSMGNVISLSLAIEATQF